jgi:chaperonin GroEL (HSP60 family)
MAIADLVKTTLGPKGMVSQTAVKKHGVAQLTTGTYERA